MKINFAFLTGMGVCFLFWEVVIKYFVLPAL